MQWRRWGSNTRSQDKHSTTPKTYKCNAFFVWNGFHHILKYNFFQKEDVGETIN